MAKASNTSIGNENSYTKEFFSELHQKIGSKDRNLIANLNRAVILAAQAYMRSHHEHQTQLAAHQVEKELEKARNKIDQAVEPLKKIFMSGNYSADVAHNIHNVIKKRYPYLQSKIVEKRGMAEVTSPAKALHYLEAVKDGIDRTLEDYKRKNALPKSTALNKWLMIIAAHLEATIGRNLEQSHYYKDGNKGKYISKKEIGDSELLLFMISPLDPNVTITQIETALKDTRKERHENPWSDYFPG